MNEVFLPPRHSLQAVQTRLKNFLWGMASRFALQGLCTWELEDHWLLMPRMEMRLAGLGQGFDGTVLCHLSDVHLSPLMRERHLQQYIDIVNRMEPDFIVITGDFITASARHYARKVGILSQLHARIAVLACLGNHDYGVWKPQGNTGVRGLGDYVAEQLDRCGIVPLVNNSQTYCREGSKIHFVGIGELWTSLYDPAAAFWSIPDDEPIIALCHNPDAAYDLASFGADLILSGHTHGKYVADTRINNLLFPVEYRHFVAGRYDLGDRRLLYVNRGMGHARRNAEHHRPEIPVFTLCDARPRVRTPNGHRDKLAVS